VALMRIRTVLSLILAAIICSRVAVPAQIW